MASLIAGLRRVVTRRLRRSSRSGMVVRPSTGARFDADELTRVDAPTYDRMASRLSELASSTASTTVTVATPPARYPGDLSAFDRARDATILVRARPRSVAELAVAFLLGAAVASLVAYLAMR